MMLFRFVAAFAFSCAIAFPLKAQEQKHDAATTPAMREVSPGVYEMGSIHLDKNTRTLTFPGRLNMAEGSLEYLICTPQGSTHESLLVTDVQPRDLHFAMLLLDAKGSGILAPAPGDAPPAQIDAEYLKHAPRLKGDDVTITVKWKDAAGKEHSAPVEDWVMNDQDKKAAKRGPWIYNGSMFASEKFLAQTEGSIAALVNNPAALMNNPRKGDDDDQIWMVNVKSVPPVETKLEITIKIETASDPQPSP